MTDKIEFEPNYGTRESVAQIKVIGVGGGGSNAVEHMYSEGIVGVDFLICNTDRGHLEKSPIPYKLLLGSGLGAGANPEVARQYAVDSKDKIMEFIGKETKMLFITAGLGKGTGTGASPVIAQVAREMGILTVGVVTIPFNFEGCSAVSQAEKGLEEISKNVDSLIVVKNENILKFYKDFPIKSAYGFADDVLKNAVKCISELIAVHYKQNVDFNDVTTIMKQSGKAMLGLAAASGTDRVERVVEEVLSCPLLDNSKIENAKNFLFFVSYGPEQELTMSELSSITESFKKHISTDAKIIWGQGEDPNLGDQLKLSLIVTSFNNEQPKMTNNYITENQDEITVVQNQSMNSGMSQQRVGVQQPRQPFGAPAAPQPDPWGGNVGRVPNDMDELLGTGGVNKMPGTRNTYDLTNGTPQPMNPATNQIGFAYGPANNPQTDTPSQTVDMMQQPVQQPMQPQMMQQPVQQPMQPQMMQQPVQQPMQSQMMQQPVQQPTMQAVDVQQAVYISMPDALQPEPNCLFQDVNDFNRKRNVPAAERMNVMHNGTVQSAAMSSMDMENHPLFENMTSMKRYTTDLSD